MKKMESTQKNITHGLLSRFVVIMAFLFAGGGVPLPLSDHTSCSTAMPRP